MPDDVQVLGRLLALAALIAATIEYAELIRRRAAARRWFAELDARHEVGLSGLVRVMLADRS